MKKPETVVIKFVADTTDLDKAIKKLEKIEALQKRVSKKK